MFTIKIPLYLGRENGEYDCEAFCENVKFLGRPLPIKMHTKRFIFKETQKATISYENAVGRLEKKIEKQYPNAGIKMEFIDNYTYATLSAKIYETRDIATPQKIVLSNEK